MTRPRLASRCWRFVKHERWSLFLGMLLIGLIQFGEYHELLAGPEGIILDLWIRSAGTPKTMAPIVIVDVDDGSYHDCFGGQSPMSPPLIEKVLKQLVGTPASAFPAVLGVDILTDEKDEKKKKDYESLQKFSQDSDPYTAVVWAAPAEHADVGIPDFWHWLWSGEEDVVAEAAPVLGKDPPELNALRPQDAGIGAGNTIYWAMPVYPTDQDLRLRRFPRTIFIGNPGLNADEPTWPRTIAELRRSREVQREFAGKPTPPGQFDDRVKEVIVSYNVNFPPRFLLNKLFECKGSLPDISIEWNPGKSKEYSDAVQASNHPVVLFGGTFETGRDSHTTSIGQVSGLMINAYALAAEMRETSGIGIREMPHRVLVALDVVVMVMIVWAFALGKQLSASVADVRRLLARTPIENLVWLERKLASGWLDWFTPLRVQMLVSLAVPVATLALSWIFFSLGYIWLSCVGIGFGFLLHLPMEIFIQSGPQTRKH